MKKIQSSPWGTPTRITWLSDDIAEVKTAGHGGYFLEKSSWNSFVSIFPDFKPWGGNTQWLEEDCDAALLPVFRPELFEKCRVSDAINYVLRNTRYFPWAVGFFETNHGKKVLDYCKE